MTAVLIAIATYLGLLALALAGMVWTAFWGDWS